VKGGITPGPTAKTPEIEIEYLSYVKGWGRNTMAAKRKGLLLRETGGPKSLAEVPSCELWAKNAPAWGRRKICGVDHGKNILSARRKKRKQSNGTGEDKSLHSSLGRLLDGEIIVGKEC